MISSDIYYDIEYDIIHQYQMILGILVIPMISVNVMISYSISYMTSWI